MAGTVSQEEVLAGQAAYTRGLLSVYDLVVSFNSSFLWRCPRRRLVRLYDEHVAERHLDIGVATGGLLNACRFPTASPQITLMDLNPNSLAAAAKRLSRYRPTIHRANVLEPFGLPASSFDSIGLSYLLHCLPGAIADKAVVFEHCRAVLAPGGVVFGSTVLYGGVRHTPVSRFVLKRFNRRGYGSNLEDDLVGLEAALARHFPSHKVEVVGAVALFAAGA